MTDRAMQALYLLGLDPIAESQADGHSYGFRLERRCADALAQTHVVLSHRHGPQWILEGDIKACFDMISHDWLLAHVPMDKTLLRQWLKAGFLEKHAWFATTEGTPQGGIVTPPTMLRTTLLGASLKRGRTDPIHDADLLLVNLDLLH
jgi:RNA-directed DNA polymerase